MPTPAPLTRLAFAVLLLTAPALAQQQAPAAPVLPPRFGDNPMQGQGRMLRHMARDRNVLRQKAIVDDADRLLALARQLSAAMDKSSTSALPPGALHTASEIEKLAKTVKERMKNGD